MTFDPAIPTATMTLAASQGPIQTNFNQIDICFNNNHVGLRDGVVADRGKHRYSIYQQQGAAPAVAGTDAALYTLTAGGAPGLFWRRPGGAGFRLIGPTTPVVAANGCSILPGGLKIQWGTAHVASGASAAIVFPIAFSANPYSITANFIRTATTTVTALYVLDGFITPAQFRTLSVGTSGGHDIYWVAIGPE